MAPATPVADPAQAAGEPLMVLISENAAQAATVAPPPPVGIAATELLLVLWLGGALLFLGWRVREYRRMRMDLLDQAAPVGEAGKVRLVETPAVTSPVAFGIFDKVVALPPAFMAHHDRAARDMAIAHELAHHRGHDLLANIAAQPLLALHWFNPLAWWGWRAMRRDQEAACDARVVAGRSRGERAAYAQVIAGFAAGGHLALAAPMACPVLGEKSIIHRLRSLTMTDISSRRRRFGIAAITTTALALPLTASITYAQAEEPQDHGTHEQRTETVDTDGNREVRVIRWVGSEGADGEHADGEHRQVHVIQLDGDGEHGDGEHRVIRFHGEGAGGMSEAEIEAMIAEIRRETGDIDEQVRTEIRIAMADAEAARGEAEQHRRIIMRRDGTDHAAMQAECSGDEPVVHRELEDGRQMVMICQTAVHEQAAAGLREALAEIANDPDVPDDIRETVTRELQRQIERLESESLSWQSEGGKAEGTVFALTPAAQAAAMRWTGRMVRPVAAPQAPTAVQVINWRVAAPVAPLAPNAPPHT
jgi:beta-lactamase regulating signal transducer with metallopeptidase domain